MKTNRRNLMMTLCALSMALVLALAGCSAALPNRNSVPSSNAAAVSTFSAEADDTAAVPTSYTVTIDVNPSIELTVTDGTVSGIKAYNDDGAELLMTADVIGATAEDAVKNLSLELANGGYFNNADLQSYLVITVSDGETENTELAAQLAEKAEATLEELQLDVRVESTEVTQEEIDAAAAMNISVGRYILYESIAKEKGITIDEVVAQYGTLNMAQLLDMFGSAENDLACRGLGGLTLEQKAIVGPALLTFKDEVNAAERAYHQALMDIKGQYRGQINELKKQYKDGDQAEYAAKLAALEQEMLTAGEGALNTFDAAVETAKGKFTESVSGAELSEDRLNTYLEKITKEEIQPTDGTEELTDGLDTELETNGNGKGNGNSDKAANGNKDNPNRGGANRGGKGGDDTEQEETEQEEPETPDAD